MFRRIFGSRLPAARPRLVPPPRRQRVLAHRSLVCSFLLTLLLSLSQVLGNWGFLAQPAEAASLVVNALRSEQVWPSNVSTCPPM